MITVYDQSMALQRILDESSEPILDRYAIISLETINEQRDSCPIRVARAGVAYFIDDELTTDSLINPVQQFGEIVLKGTVPRVKCIDVSGRLVLALPFFEAKILGPAYEVEPEIIELELDDCDTVLPLGTTISRPLYAPVESLSFIMFAALI